MQPNLEIFCIDLYINSYSNKIIFSKYRQIFNELDNTITFVGLQHKNIDTKIYTIRHIIKNISKSKNDAVFQYYKEQFNQILQITKESADNMDAQQFETLWSIFYILPPKYLHELFDISFGLLETRKFPPNCQMKLLNIILTDYMKINPMYLEEIITLYFTAQASVEDIDFMNQIFINLSRVDFAQSYELFKTNILSLLESTNEYQQYIGLFMINDFINTYMFYINSEISTIIHCTLQIEPFTIENFKLISNYLVDYLNFNKISYKDAENIYCGILELFVNSASTDFLYQAYKISQKIGPNPIYFDGFIESFDKVQFDSLPIYFSLLLNLYSVENDMSDQKYEPFFEFLTQNFELGCQKLDELWPQLEEDWRNGELLEQCHQFALLRNTSSNLLYLFSIFNPCRFSGCFEITNQCFIDILRKEYLKEVDDDNFGLSEINKDFARVFKIIKSTNYVDILKDFYRDICNADNDDDIKHIFIEMDNSGYTERSEFWDRFKDIVKSFRSMTKDEIVYFTNETILPISKWLYKENNQKLHNCFINLILCLFHYSKISYELPIYFTRIIKRIVKPKRVIYNEENEWYSVYCVKIVKCMKLFSS